MKRPFVLIASAIIITACSLAALYYYGCGRSSGNGPPPPHYIQPRRSRMKHAALPANAVPRKTVAVPALKVTFAELKLLVANPRPHHLAQWYKKAKRRGHARASDFDFTGAKGVWVYGTSPRTNDEFHRGLGFARLEAINKLEAFAAKKQWAEAKLALYGYFATYLLDAFDYVPSSSPGQLGHLKFQTPSNAAIMAKPANGKMKFQWRDLLWSQAFADTAYAEGPYKVPVFFDNDLAPFSELSRDAADATSLTSKVFDALDAVLNTLKAIPIFSDKSEDLHRSNIANIVTVIADARKNPKKYGLKQLTYTTDLDYAVLAKPVLLGAATSTTLMYAGAAMILSPIFSAGGVVRATGIFGVVTQMGLDLVFTAVNTYLGGKRLYMLQDYYTYLWTERLSKKQAGKPFMEKEAIALYDPNKVKFNLNFRRQTDAAWVMAATLARPAIGLFQDSALLGMEWVSRRVLSQITLGSGANAFNLWNWYNKVFTHMMKNPKTIEGYLATRYRELFFKFATRIPFFGPALKQIIELTPGRALTMLGGAAFNSLRIFVTMYFSLDITAGMLSQVYGEPGLPIRLAYADDLSKTRRPFLQASREYFYPLCIFMAERADNQVPTAFYPETPDQLTLRRKEKCARVIAAIEGVDVSDLINVVKDTALAITDQKSDHYRDVSLLDWVQRSKLYPNSYKVFWFGGLKAIYPADYMPSIYWQLRQAVFSASYDGVAAIINSDRFNYILDLAATEKAAAVIKTQDLADPRIPKSLSEDDVFKEFVDYERRQAKGDFCHYMAVYEEQPGVSTNPFVHGVMRVALPFGRALKETVGVWRWVFSSARSDASTLQFQSNMRLFIQRAFAF